jgi:peptide chain release factor
MAAVEIDAALRQRMDRLGLREENLEEAFVRGTGPGGQKINKTASTVVLRDPASGCETRCQRERSQSANRYWARVELCEQIEAARHAARLSKEQASEKKTASVPSASQGFAGEDSQDKTEAIRGEKGSGQGAGRVSAGD